MVNFHGISLPLFLLVGIYGASAQEYYELDSKEFFEIAAVSQKIDPETFNADLLKAAVFHYTNEERQKRKKSQLIFSKILERSADSHAHYLEGHQMVDHFNRHNKKLRTPSERIAQAGGDFRAIAENLARLSAMVLEKNASFYISKSGELQHEDGTPLEYHTYKSLARKVVSRWMNSKGHRTNILGDYRFLGCGLSAITFNSQGLPEIYFVQNFANN